MKKYHICLFVLLLMACKGQKSIHNISCAGMVTIQYDKKKSADEQTVKKGTKGYSVYFINEYDDQIEAYVNGKLHFEKYIKIKEGSDDLDNYFGFDDDDKSLVLKIVSKTKHTCFDIQINKKYKIIYIFLSREGKWIARFSNVYYMI